MKAPQGDGEILAVPALDRAGAVVECNRRLLDTGAFVDLRREARRQLLEAAAQYLGEAVPSADGPILLAGHQPELFHPGVWVKNFALAGLARKTGGIAVNLIVDNDSLKSPSLAVPVRHAGTVRLEPIPFDVSGIDAVFEERPVLDRGLFSSFADRVCGSMQEWKIDPLVRELWPTAVDQPEHLSLGERLVRARRSLERRWGCKNLELPVSLLSETPAFRHFVSDLLLRLPAWHAAYNDIVRTYRQRHGIRSRHHPVPDLATEGDWLEAPLWAWRAGSGKRSRLFARLRSEKVEMRIGTEILPARADEWKIRPRALSTTLAARLFFGAVFLHGIGGAIYDELTDELIRRLYGIEPPGFMVLSATLRLPIAAPLVSDAERRRLHRLLRDLEWNPQRFIEADDLVRQKRSLMEEIPAAGPGRKARFRALQDLTRRMRPAAAERRRQTIEEVARLDRQLHERDVLRRRDYSLGLFPVAQLERFCRQFL